MDLISLESLLDNTSFGVLLVTMLIYWTGAAFPKLPLLATLGTTGMAVANLCMATLLGSRWIEAGYFPPQQFIRIFILSRLGHYRHPLCCRKNESQPFGRGSYQPCGDVHYGFCSPELTRRNAGICALSTRA